MTIMQEKPDLKLTEDRDLLATSAAGGNEQKRQALQVTEDARKDLTLPSFGAQLFLGNFAYDMMYPYPTQSEEDKKIGDALIEKLMTFLHENLDPEEVDATREIPKNVIEGMKKMGIFALKVPKKYGGLDFSQTNYCRLVMNVASYCGSTAVLISAHQSIGVPQPLKMFGTEEQKNKFYPRFAQGAISAFALTEPEVGSDPAQMSTKAELSSDGKYYIINGEKLWCTNGTVADLIVVTAQTTPKMIKGKERKQISAFIVETKTPGFEVLHRCEFMGLGGIYNGYIRFTNVKVPVENLLWEEGRGLALALATINVGRLTLPAACTGAAKACLSISRKWGESRIQWGMPVGLHEAGRSKISYIAATTLAMEAVTWLTCAWAEKEKVDIRIEAAMAKMFCTESLWKIVDMTMQLRGGRGYEKARSLEARGEPGYPVERIMRDCRINTILEGSTEIMKLFLAREAMDPHLKRMSDLINPKTSINDKIKTATQAAGHYSVWFTKQLFGGLFTNSYPHSGKLKKHLIFIERNAHKLASKIFLAMARYQQNLEKKQLLLGRLMDIGTDLFAMAATCSFALKLNEDTTKNESPIELADIFCIIAERRIRENFSALSNNDDKMGNALAKDVINGSCKWLEEGIFLKEPKNLS